MKKFLVLVLCAAIVLAGCAASRPSMKLDARWSPLVDIIQDGSQVRSPTMTTCDVPHLYTANLAWWQNYYQDGTPYREGILTHEWTHADSQVNYAPWLGEFLSREAWDFRYNHDKKFLIREEEKAYAAQIRVLEKAHAAYDPMDFVDILSGPAYGYVISHDDALAFVVSAVDSAQAH
jgi:hypothetical protein